MMSRHILNLLNNFGSAIFTATGGGSVILGSIILQEKKQQRADISSWRTVEYPTSKVNATREKSRSGEAQANEETGVKLSRKLLSDVDRTGLGLRLYQYQTCPYCCKLRAFLDYYGFSYEVVEVNPVTRSQIKFSKDYKKVPILRSHSLVQPMIESSQIISILATFLVREELELPEVVALYPEHLGFDEKSGKEIFKRPNQYFVMWSEIRPSDKQMQDLREEREWREWVDSHFIHLISPNVYRSLSEALETFRWFDQVGEWKRNFPAWERFLAVYLGAAAMWGISKRLKKRHNIDDEREALYDGFKKFLDARGPNRKFMGGEQPNLADIAFYGAINSFAGCIAFTEICHQLADLKIWFDAVDQAVKEGRGRSLVERKSKIIVSKRDV